MATTITDGLDAMLKLHAAAHTPRSMDQMIADIVAMPQEFQSEIEKAAQQAMSTGTGAYLLGVDMASGPDQTLEFSVAHFDVTQPHWPNGCTVHINPKPGQMLQGVRKCICCGLPETEVQHD